MEPNTLLSISMQSNRPQKFLSFLDRLESSAQNPRRIEVVVKIDDDDKEMNALLRLEPARRMLRLKYISTPLPDGFYGLWRSMEDLRQASDSNAYFLLNMNDEMWFDTKYWDEILDRYVGFFPDNIFRLRASGNRHHKYSDLWECGYAPDNCAFTTRKWLEATEGWTPCTGPESFQQCVSFHFSNFSRNQSGRSHRDIPIDAIRVRGEGANIGVSDMAALRIRQKGAIRQWFILMSYRNQQEAARRARLLEARIISAANPEVNVIDDVQNKRISLVMPNSRNQSLSYGISKYKVSKTNFFRLFNFYYFAGEANTLGFRPFRNSMLLLALLLEGTLVLEWYRAARRSIRGIVCTPNE